jgi:pyrimidine-nucleoside phosphorylase
VAGQSADLAPVDGMLYALRDVTATVESLPLIASSVMSKKIAAGADVIVLDVKVGSGAFMKTDAEAEQLANLMVAIGRSVGRKVAAVIADMNQPLGCAVGNALEVKEAIEVLQGRGPLDLRDHCLTIGSMMLLLGDRATSLEEARTRLAQALDDGLAWQKFVEWIAAQGGNVALLEQPALLPGASIIEDLPSPQDGYLAEINARQVGLASVLLGAGREKKGDPIDYGVGIVLHKKVGDQVQGGETLATLYASDPGKLAAARAHLVTAFRWSKTPIQPPAHIHKIILQDLRSRAVH